MSNQYFWERITGHDPALRAADADRERIAERLRKGHAEGRLDMTEFQERLERCYAAKTLGELDMLVRDLPRPDDLAAPRPAGPLQPWRWRLRALAPILIALFVLSAAAHHHVFWLWIPLLFLFWRLSWFSPRRRWSAGPRRRWDQSI